MFFSCQRRCKKLFLPLGADKHVPIGCSTKAMIDSLESNYCVDKNAAFDEIVVGIAQRDVAEDGE